MADNGEEEQEDGVVTYYVDENGQYYYKPTEQGQGLVSLPVGSDNTADTPLKDPIMVGETDAESYQRVAYVPSESSNGVVNYVIVVQEENEHNVDQDNSDVFLFQPVEIENNASEEELNQPPKKKRTKGKGELFSCKLCTYTCSRRYLLLRHNQIHSDERPHKCDVCERCFKTVSGLQNHVNTHKGIKPHSCKHCKSSFTTSGELVRHIRYKHTHEKPHKCTECDYAAVELSKLRRHIRCHTGERPFQCQHCTYASPDAFKLKRHIRTHTAEKPYKCDMCEMCFTQSNTLKAHQRIHNVSEKPVFQCETCPANYRRKLDLCLHIQKLHMADKPRQCKKCGKSFIDKYSCKVHNKTHKGEKCFKCQLCPYTATTCRQLKNHFRRHRNERLHLCDLCDQSFRQKQLLSRHHKLCHSPKFVPKPINGNTNSCHYCNRDFAHKGHLIRHLAIHEAYSGHGRQKNVKNIDAGKKMVEPDGTASVTLKVSADKHRELVTVSDHEGQQYVWLEVIPLEDGIQQPVTFIASDHNTQVDHEELGSYEYEQVEEEENNNVEEEILPLEMMEPLSKYNIELEQEIYASFGFEEN